eukprot:scaffold1318_cov388-Prasinococcus_capsulatus_cf.AAC.86
MPAALLCSPVDGERASGSPTAKAKVGEKDGVDQCDRSSATQTGLTAAQKKKKRQSASKLVEKLQVMLVKKHAVISEQYDPTSTLA